MFSERLAKLRSNLNLSQKELSSRLGIARTTYAGYENGSREPDLNMLNKLSEFFNVSVHWLVTGNEKTISEEDQILLNSFSKLSERDQIIVLDLMERLKKEQL